MEYSEREYLINQIISGCTMCSFNDEPVLVFEASPKDKVVAHTIFLDELKKAELLGLSSEKEILHEMKLRGMWSDFLESELNKLPKAIEELKVELYQAYFQFQRRDNIKKSLDSLRAKEVKLLQQKESLSHVTIEGFAISCKNKHLICSGTKNIDGSDFFVNGYEHYSQNHLDAFMRDFLSKKVDQNVIRMLSQEEPWRTIWSSGKSEGAVFGIPSALLSQDQKLLLVWSKIYDNVYESSECPPDEVIADDDCLDGFLISQARKREKERQSEHGYKPGDKFNKADEVFIFVENPEDAARVHSMNSPAAIFRMQQRMHALNKAGGKLEDQYMPDAQQNLREQAVQLMNKHVKGK